jgi:hypothetical protein
VKRGLPVIASDRTLQDQSVLLGTVTLSHEAVRAAARAAAHSDCGCLALRLYRLDLQDVWWDEARNIEVASASGHQIATAGELDIHPPVYFYTLHGWMAVARMSAFALRFLSTWFGVLLVGLMYALGHRSAGVWGGVWRGAGRRVVALPAR